ncbi:VCBS repeat domain-containing M23 family metallopeptidase [Microbacterium maritypicum]|uniref:VCBS repeat domain-containing M23 family metallopeptidase n=1 Tax=Microbacterium maritypicum TaxID=33918 RepID=A0ACD4B7N7_MICMQ|nr:VCBS repeat domain-containing M23 family metallopeptidase [Microbacterium liquefaciens]MBP5800787.1 VCBS repeat domain-containing M23 family metallopeptidase [Microbacterium liquefaciens]UTT53528.1 VCBS repeat domain-containing M23 family metallopeptidase [Microbacterium liquefaciens]
MGIAPLGPSNKGNFEMKGPSRLRLGRIGIATALAVVIGALVPSLSASISATAATDGQMVYPASGNIQSKVGDGCRGNYRAHEGIDISAAGGTPILAAYSGVIKSRTVNSGYGNYTDVEHPGGYVTRYAHMASPGIYAPGTRVERGQQIGIVGNTGNSPAYHLHFEVRRNGAVYTGINDGFVCLTNVARGGTIPLTFPGLRTESGPPIPPADFTGDGRSDLLLVAGNGDLRLRAGTGSGGFQAPTTLVSGWAGDRRHLTRADLNGDGRGDVLAARTDGVLEFSAGNGAGGVAAPVGIGAGWYDMLHVTSGADYTGDGKQDVVGVSPGGVLVIYPGNGAGGLGGTPKTVGGGWHGFHFLVGGDFNNDGWGDLMAMSDNGTLYFYPRVSGGASPPVVVGSGWLEFTAATGGADYDGDGRADLLVRTAAGELFFYPGNGDGGFGARRLVSADWADHLAIE